MNISVVIAAHNVQLWLPQTLDSVLKQTHPVSEIIVVDDGSTDETIASARRVSPDIVLLRQPNRGPGSAKNRGAKAASGEGLLFLDADDLLLPHAVETLVGCWDKLPDAKAIDPRYEIIEADGSLHPGPSFRREVYGRSQLASVLLRNPFGGNALIEREEWEAHPYPEDQTLRFCEDLHLWIHLLLDGAQIAMPPEILIRRREGRLGAATSQLLAMRRDRNRLFRELRADSRLTRLEQFIVVYQIMKTSLGVRVAARH